MSATPARKPKAEAPAAAPRATVLHLPPRPSTAPAKPKARFYWEKFSKVARELVPLIRRQHDAFRPEATLDVDWDRYYAWDQIGALQVLTVRAPDDKLVGFLIAFATKHRWHMSQGWMVTDAFWLEPEHRHGWTGVRMFRFLVRRAKKLGCRRVYVSFEPEYKDLAPVMKRLGFKPAEQTWGMTL